MVSGETTSGGPPPIVLSGVLDKGSVQHADLYSYRLDKGAVEITLVL